MNKVITRYIQVTEGADLLGKSLTNIKEFKDIEEEIMHCNNKSTKICATMKTRPMEERRNILAESSRVAGQAKELRDRESELSSKVLDLKDKEIQILEKATKIRKEAAMFQ